MSEMIYTADKAGLHRRIKELEAQLAIANEALEWALSGDTGVSSEALVAKALGVQPRKYYFGCAPADSADRGRCVRAIQKLPSILASLDEMISEDPKWEEQIPLIREALAKLKPEPPMHVRV